MEENKNLFAVSLFYRKIVKQINSETTQERLICKIVSAINENEAFGIAYSLCRKDYYDFNLVHELTVKISNDISK